MAYDNSNVTVVGGFGSQIVGGSNASDGTTYSYANQPCHIAGRLTVFKMHFYNWTWTPPDTFTSAKLKVFRGTAGNCAITDYDISVPMQAAITALGGVDHFLLDLTTWLLTNEITIVAGDWFGVFTDVASSVTPMENNTLAIASQYKEAGDQTGSGIDMPTDWTTETDSALLEFAIESNELIIQDDSTGWGTGEFIPVMSYADQPYYIILEEVVVPDAEDLAISLSYTATNAVDTVEDVLTLDFTGDAQDLTLTTEGSTKVVAVNAVTHADTVATVHRCIKTHLSAAANNPSDGASKATYWEVDVARTADGEWVDATKYYTNAEKKINIYIYVDPVNDKLEVLYCNLEEGQGSQGITDLKYISLTGRVPFAATDTVIRRIGLVQGTGVGATVASIVVCRDPQVISIDSFVAGNNGATANIGTQLAAAGTWPEDRYTIVTGITGNELSDDTANAHTAFLTRLDNVSTDQDIVGFRDVVHILVCGFANDVETIDSNAEAEERAAELISWVAEAVGKIKKDTDTYGGRNDIVLCGPIGAPPDTVAGANGAYYQRCFSRANSGLRTLAYAANIPFVDNYGYGLTTQFTSFEADNNWHPSSAGSSSIAKAIVTAYENNYVPDVLSLNEGNNPYASWRRLK